MVYSKNNVTFSSFDGNSFARGKKVSNNKYLYATVNDLNEIESDNNGKLPTIINALEIDWNNAILSNGDSSTGGNKQIKTTEDLLKQIDNIQKEIYVLTDIIFSYIK